MGRQLVLVVAFSCSDCAGSDYAHAVGAWCHQVLEGAEGLPIAVQLACLPWREETCLRAMRAVEQAVRFERPVWRDELLVPRETLELGGRPVLKRAAAGVAKL